MAGKSVDDEDIHEIDSNFADVMVFCRFYGKFATGASLFIHKVMCFAILVDSFNMHKYHDIILFEPYCLIAIMFGVAGMKILVALDLHCLTRFVQYFMHRINTFEASKINEEGYEPDLIGICNDLLRLTFINQSLFFFFPVRNFFKIIFRL